MRGLLSGLLVLVALALGIQAFNRFTVTPARYVEPNIDGAIELAARLNAADDSDVRAYLAEVERTGELDVRRLGSLLRPRAQNAGELSRLQDELERLAAGDTEQPAPRASARPAGTAAAARQVVSAPPPEADAEPPRPLDIAPAAPPSCRTPRGT